MTNNVSNSGIAHLSHKAGGQPLCKSRRAHICVAIEDAEKEPRVCARCAAKLAKRRQAKFSSREIQSLNTD